MILIAIKAGLFIRAKRKEKRLSCINTLFPDVETAFNDIAEHFSFGHYLTESERKEIKSRYFELNKEVHRLIGSKELKESEHGDLFIRFHNALSDTLAHKEENNQRFKEKQLSLCKEYFDTVLAYPLDEQQRDAIVTLEDNVLVISSAGSGKTMTTVGKVRYLIDVQKVDPEKILLITFTRKAAESLSERLGEKNLKCRTFHKLALEIIGEATGKKPTITDPDFSVQVYHKLMEGPSYKQDIVDYLNRSRYKGKSQFEYCSDARCKVYQAPYHQPGNPQYNCQRQPQNPCATRPESDPHKGSEPCSCPAPYRKDNYPPCCTQHYPYSPCTPKNPYIRS